MVLEHLRVKYVRNISNIHLEPSVGLNFITGPNASGKTALLESIHLLARARSFRTPRIREVIQKEQKVLQISAQLNSNNRESISTGIEKGYGTTLIKYQGKALKTVSEQANHIPLLLLTPDSHSLISGGPKERRHWLDWAMFHVEPTYIKVWKDYQKALRNRNMLLKQRSDSRQFSVWEKTMSLTAVSLNTLREQFLGALQEQLKTTLSGTYSAEPYLKYDSGCPEALSLMDYLHQQREKDKQLGYTRYGPHKADVLFLVEGKAISQSFSRGQIKRFVLALMVAQGLAQTMVCGVKPVFLVDDYSAELDDKAELETIDLLNNYGGQVFLTSTKTDREIIPLENASLFHVERGNFIKVLK